MTGAGAESGVPVTDRAWTREMLTTTSGQRVLALAVEHGTDIFKRAAPLWPAVAVAAAGDPDVERYWASVSADRRAGQARMVARLTELGALRPGWTRPVQPILSSSSSGTRCSAASSSKRAGKSPPTRPGSSQPSSNSSWNSRASIARH